MTKGDGGGAVRGNRRGAAERPCERGVQRVRRACEAAGAPKGGTEEAYEERKFFSKLLSVNLFKAASIFRFSALPNGIRELYPLSALRRLGSRFGSLRRGEH